MGRDSFDDIEGELRNLIVYKKAIEQRRYDLYDKGPKNDITSKNISDPTAYEVIRRDRIEKEIKIYEEKVKALEFAITSLGEAEEKLISLMYLSGKDYNNSETMVLLSISKNKYYKLKWSALEKLREVLGKEYFVKWSKSGQNKDK